MTFLQRACQLSALSVSTPMGGVHVDERAPAAISDSQAQPPDSLTEATVLKEASLILAL